MGRTPQEGNSGTESELIMADEAVANMRTQIESLESQLDDTKKELASVQTERDTLGVKVRSFEATQYGLTLPQAELFVKEIGDKDISEESVVDFANRLNITLREDGEPDVTAEESAESDEGKDAPLSSMARASSGSGSSSAAGAEGQTMNRAEWRELHKKDPAAAREAFRQGRVELREDNFWVQNAS